LSNEQDARANSRESEVQLVASPPRETNVFEGSRDSANKGMFVDPAQTPMTLMEPSMQAAQSAAPETPMTVSDSTAPQAGAQGE
jgi:hypothetical protein